MFKEKYLIKKAKQKKKTIVFPEADLCDRIVYAGKYIASKKIAKVIFIGNQSALNLRFKNLKNITIINPKTSSLVENFADKLYILRKEKGLTKEKAKELVLDPFYFATMLVNEGYADGMVGGARVSTKTNLLPALQIIKGENGKKVSSGFLFYGKNKLLKNKPLLIGDAGLNEFPNEQTLSLIGENLANFSTEILNINPRLAFLSYSSKGSADSDSVEMVRKAVNIFKENNEYLCDGEVQLDSALIPDVAKLKIKDSYLTNQNANTLIVPDINSGNILYKAIQRFSKLNAIGPIVMGLKKPVNDLSRGCDIHDIIMLTVITVLQCK